MDISRYFLNIGHILIIGSFLIYVGYFKPQNKIFYVLLLLGAVTILFAFGLHSIGPWMLVHLVLFFTLLGFTGYIGTFMSPAKVPDYLYSFLLAVGVAAFGYHFLRMVKRI